MKITTMEISVRKFLILAFRVLCVLTTLVMCAYWGHKFTLNKDYSVITYKKFDGEVGDIHPTISFCLKNPFLKNRLAGYGVNISSYLSFLKGHHFAESMLNIDYNNVTIDISDYIKGYRIYFRNGSINKFDSGLSKKEKKTLTFVSFNGISGYQGHFMKCFALNMPKSRDLYIFRILLSNSVFPNSTRPLYNGLRIYFHLPQQFLLSHSWMMWLWPYRASNEYYKMRFLIENVTIMKKRNKSDAKCNQFENNYDDWVIGRHKDKTTCNNPYQKMDERLPMCTNQELMRKGLFDTLTAEKLKLEKPCKMIQAVEWKHVESHIEMLERDNVGQFWLSASLSIPTFKQIEQERYFVLCICCEHGHKIFTTKSISHNMTY